jgi:hypothetical protein
LSAQEQLTLYVGAGRPDLALPNWYLGLPGITVISAPAGKMTDERCCPRCAEPWVGHQWVLFTGRSHPLDCSFEPRQQPA